MMESEQCPGAFGKIQRAEEGVGKFAHSTVTLLRDPINTIFTKIGIIRRRLKSPDLLIQKQVKETVLETEDNLTTQEGAILAVAIAEASTRLEVKGIFKLNREFHGFFGRLCSFLPPEGLGKMNASSYNETKRAITKKIRSQVVKPGDDGTVSGEVTPLIDWIKTNVVCKEEFYTAIASDGVCSDQDAVVDLRIKFRAVMEALTAEKFARDLSEVARPGEEELKKQKELEEARKLGKDRKIAESEIKNQQEKDKDQLAANMRTILVGLYSKDSNYHGMLNEAKAVIPILQRRKRLSLAEKAFAIANLEHRQATELNYTEEEMRLIIDTAVRIEKEEFINKRP